VTESSRFPTQTRKKVLGTFGIRVRVAKPTRHRTDAGKRTPPPAHPFLTDQRCQTAGHAERGRVPHSHREAAFPLLFWIPWRPVARSEGPKSIAATSTTRNAQSAGREVAVISSETPSAPYSTRAVSGRVYRTSARDCPARSFKKSAKFRAPRHSPVGFGGHQVFHI